MDYRMAFSGVARVGSWGELEGYSRKTQIEKDEMGRRVPFRGCLG
jgi:hypothetical protein